MRILLIALAPLALPTLVFVLVEFLLRRRVPAWRLMPWAWLTAAGLALALLLMAGGYLMNDYNTAGIYEPAYVDQQGRIVPGRYR
ncbi:MAG: hypothetical protein K2Q10_05420 [Rhodospirillales bacterium]|nr:hypothetical protein [Rhodospirillales bacterium]